MGGMSVATTRSSASNEQGAKQVLGIQSNDGKACSTRWLWRRGCLLPRRQFLCAYHPAFLPGPVAAPELIEAAAAVRNNLSLNLRFGRRPPPTRLAGAHQEVDRDPACRAKALRGEPSSWQLRAACAPRDSLCGRGTQTLESFPFRQRVSE